MSARGHENGKRDRELVAHELETRKRDHDSGFQCTQPNFPAPNIIFPLYPPPKTAAVKFQPKFSSIFYDAEENLAAKPLLTHKKTQGKVPWVFNYFYLLSIFCWFFFCWFFFSRFFVFCWCFLFCRLFAFSRSFFRSFFWCCILWSFCRFFLLWHVSSHSAD